MRQTQNIQIPLLLMIFGTTFKGGESLCPSKCSCDDILLKVNCENSGIDVVPITLHPGLRELYLGKNLIKSLKDSVNVYHELTHLNLSQNCLKTIDDKTFENHDHLKHLTLHMNAIRNLYNDSFHGLVGMQILDLSHNALEDLPPRIFRTLRNLVKLDLSSNLLLEIIDEVFLGLRRLEVLILRHNLLSSVPVESLQGLPNLLILDLGMNAFDIVPKDAFTAMYNLRELFLDGNCVHNVDIHAFRWLTSLLKLELQENNIVQVPVRALFDVTRLESLDVSKNLFNSINAMSFQRLRYLKVIRINHCRNLEVIREYAFKENANLERVFIENNINLITIEPGAFDDAFNLRYISLKGNSLKTLHSDLLPWQNLVFVDIKDNPLICDCELQWLWHVLQSETQDLPTPEGLHMPPVVCREPEIFRGKFLKDVPSSNVECHYSQKKLYIIIGVAILFGLLITVFFVIFSRFRRKKILNRNLDPEWQKRQTSLRYDFAEDEKFLRKDVLYSAKVPFNSFSSVA